MICPLLLCALISPGCASKPPPELITRLQVVRPALPAALLSCSPEPPPPATDLDDDAVEWIAAVQLAGRDCRGKLDAVRDLVDPR